ncbi:MAG: hypothetical protein L3J97_00590 [Thermoplasmata archaeon]|nr:hypothetical protein [Thermoplasmata archaeon]
MTVSKARTDAYLFELRLQCAVALGAEEQLQKDLADLRGEGAELKRILLANGGPPVLSAEREGFIAIAKRLSRKTVDVLRDIQSIVGAVGIIRGILRPQVDQAPKGRREEWQWRRSLSTVFELEDDSPIFFAAYDSNDVRGGLLHVDQQLEPYLTARGTLKPIPFNVGPLGGNAAWRPGDALRSFDEATGTVHVGDRSQPLPPLIADLKKIASHLTITGEVVPIWGDRTPSGVGIAFGVR